MAGTYQVILRDSAGAFLAQVNDFIRLEYVLTTNAVGTLTLLLPSYYGPFLIRNGELVVDSRIDVLRSVYLDTYQREGDTQWLVRRLQKPAWKPGTISVTAVSANHLLARRIVAYDAGTSQSDKVGYSDVVMRAIVDENFVSPVDGTRLMPNLSIDVGSLFVAVGGVTKSFARRRVLDILQEIANTTNNAGFFVAFDVVSLNDVNFQFRVFPGQRGKDLRTLLQPQGPNFGTMADAELLLDHAEEVTFVYAGGEGEEAARAMGEAVDATRYNLSAYNRIEAFVDARTTDDVTALENEAEAALRAGRPVRSISGAIVDTPGLIYGLDYNFGDYIRMAFGGSNLDIRVESVHITVEGSKETIDIRFRGDV